MTGRDDVVTRAEALAAASSRPVLTASEVGAAVDAAAIADQFNLAPTDPNWSPTYDLYGAVAECYRLKAAKVAGDFNFTADDASYSKGDVLANLLALEARYAAMAVQSAGRTIGAGASTIQVGGTNAGYINPLDVIASQVIP